MANFASSSDSELFTSFAIAGGLHPSFSWSSSLGLLIARALLQNGMGKKQGLKVKMLTRSSTIDPPLASELSILGIEVNQVDYTSASELASALQGIEVVVDAMIGGGSLDAQIALAKACIAEGSGVRVFLPAYFGQSPSTFEPEDMTYYKTVLQDKIKEMGVPSLVIRNGFFATAIPTLLPINDQNEIHIVGPGDVKISFIYVEDVASFVAHILTYLHPSELINQTYRIEASRLTLRTLLSTQHPTATLISIPREEAARRYAETGDPALHIGLRWDAGLGVISGREGRVGQEGGLGNGVWEGWEAKRLV